MPNAWFLDTYIGITPTNGLLWQRAPSVRQFLPQVSADGGKMAWVEVLGNRCLVLVRASAATLAAISASVQRFPVDMLTDSLSTLTAGQRQVLVTQVTDMGYSLEEINAHVDSTNLQNHTLRDVLAVMCIRRSTPRYLSGSDELVFDGPPRPTAKTFADLEREVG